MANYVIIPAAGTGSRMASDIPKQYLPLQNKPIIWHSLQVFAACAQVDQVFVVLSPDDVHWAEAMRGEVFDNKITCLTCGGDSRAQTVLNGLEAIANHANADDWVLVHDAARPGLTVGLIKKLITHLEDDEVGGLLALPLADTLKKAQADVEADAVERTIPRAHLWQAQTPQMFRYALLKRAIQQVETTPTDEAQAVEMLGLAPKLVTGALRNLKVTYPQDLNVVNALMQAEEES